MSVVFIGWPTEGVDYWNAYWRHQEKLGFFDDIQEPPPCSCLDRYDPECAEHGSW
jgi:hypothetical protein